jgi:phage baseplate assembly protein W
MPDLVDVIGKGWSFPIKVSAKGGLSWSEGPSRIQEAIWIVISTALGERLMRPDFGAGVQDFVFQPNSAIERATLASAIQEALVKSEPRIELQAVRVEESPDQESQVLVGVDYRIRATNELFNMVYPLYLQEGLV